MSVVEAGASIDRTAPRRARLALSLPQGRIVRIGLLGYGRVGQAIAALAAIERERLQSAGLDARFVGALIRDPARRRGGPPVALHTTPSDLFASSLDVLIDVMGGVDPAHQLVRRALEAGVNVVTANKTLMAAHGQSLQALARRHGVALAFDAAVLAGVPFLGALTRRPLVAAPRRMLGIVNGTSHFVACALDSGEPLAAALVRAVEQGYAERDSSADIGGRDAAEKLTILLHLAGCHSLATGDLPTTSLEVITPTDVAAAHRLGAVIKPLAIASLEAGNAGAWVGPALVDRAHAFASLSGVANAIEFTGPAGDSIRFVGPGAGPRVTALTVLDDVVEAVALRGRVAARPWTPAEVPAGRLRQPPAGAWYWRVAGAADSAHEIASLLVTNRLPVAGVVRCHGAAAGKIADTSWQHISTVADRLRESGRAVLVLPFIPT